MNWLYKGKPIYSHDDLPKEAVGFIYYITYTTGEIYIGKKLIRSLVRLKPTVAQLAKRKNYKRMEWKLKPFINYIGSHKETKGLIMTQKEIVEVCSDKINLTYAEMKHQVINDVLLDSRYLNACISGKFYEGRIKRSIG